jgi:hypothetical protein
LRYEGVSIFERKIFNEPVALLDSEITHLNKFHDFLAQTGLVLPDMFFNDPARYDLRYLTAAQFDFQKAYDRLVTYGKWKSNTFPVPKESGS